MNSQTTATAAPASPYRTETEVFKLERPAAGATPLLLDSPHSGGAMPFDFGFSIDVALLRQMEDTYVEELYQGATQAGATWLEARCSRSYIDLNRNENDLDPWLMDDVPGTLRASRDAELGRGLIWRTTPGGQPIYERRLPMAEVRQRIERFHRPYHAALCSELRRLHREFGAVWHLDCHSMPGVSGAMSLEGAAGVRRPDFVLGNGDGAACDAGFMAVVRHCLADCGYGVAENDPYKGAELTLGYSRPALGFHSLQIEINRSLYMDEATRQKHAGFDKLQRDLQRMVETVAAYVRAAV